MNICRFNLDSRVAQNVSQHSLNYKCTFTEPKGNIGLFNQRGVGCQKNCIIHLAVQPPQQQTHVWLLVVVLLIQSTYFSLIKCAVTFIVPKVNIGLFNQRGVGAEGLSYYPSSRTTSPTTDPSLVTCGSITIWKKIPECSSKKSLDNNSGIFIQSTIAPKGFLLD